MYQTNKTYFSYFIWSILLLTFLSCTDFTKKNDAEVENEVTDSINLFIQQGRNKNSKLVDRIKQLQKARDYVEKIENDSLQTVFFSKISFSYLLIGDSLPFRQTNSKTMQLAKAVGDSIREAEAHWDLADFFRSEAITDSAYYHFSEAQEIYSNLGKEYESGTMLYNMAVAQSDVKDYTGSEITTIRAIEILKPLKKFKQLYSSYSNLGAVTKELKEYDRAIEYYSTALEYQKKIESENTFDLSLKNNIGVVYQEQGKFKEAIPYFEQVLSDKSLLEKYPKLYALALNNLAYSYSKIGKEANLSGKFEKAIKIQDSIGDIASISRSHYNFAEFYLDKKDTLQALEHAKQARKYSERAKNNDRLLRTLQLLVKLEPDKAMAYNQQYIMLNDSLQQEERKVRDKFARIRFETDEFIAENEMLVREKQLWAGIAAAVLLLGLMSYFIVDQRAKNQKLRFQQEQQAANQEIFSLMLAQKQKIEEGKKMEQKRISEELHDGVLGKMLGARMVLTGLNKKTDSDAEIQRKKAIDALQDVEKEVRAISHELSHAAYQKIHNFIHSLEDLLKTVQGTGNFDYTFNYDNEFDWDALNGETKINVYRMIQESLQNCVKHAKCESVAVDLTITNNRLKVVVSDDGRGFKLKNGKKGIGMRNIASRIEKLNGEWNIESTIGKGTTVTLKVPLANTKNEKIKPAKQIQLAREV